MPPIIIKSGSFILEALFNPDEKFLTHRGGDNNIRNYEATYPGRIAAVSILQYDESPLGNVYPHGFLYCKKRLSIEIEFNNKRSAEIDYIFDENNTGGTTTFQLEFRGFKRLKKTAKRHSRRPNYWEDDDEEYGIRFEKVTLIAEDNDYPNQTPLPPYSQTAEQDLDYIIAIYEDDTRLLSERNHKAKKP